MFLLDTNVISELRRTKSKACDPGVARWAASVSEHSLYLSTMTIFEIELGALQASRYDPVKARVLRSWIDSYVIPAFRDRILSVDTEVAQRCAALHVPDTRSQRDSFIAATALVYDLTVVTRNTADFAPTGARTLNPWMARN